MKLFIGLFYIFTASTALHPVGGLFEVDWHAPRPFPEFANAHLADGSRVERSEMPELYHLLKEVGYVDPHGEVFLPDARGGILR